MSVENNSKREKVGRKGATPTPLPKSGHMNSKGKIYKIFRNPIVAMFHKLVQSIEIKGNLPIIFMKCYIHKQT